MAKELFSQPANDESPPDFRAVFESAPGLYLLLTPDFRIVAASNAYLKATMTSREAILGRDIFEVFPDNPDDLDATGVRHLRASLERVRDQCDSDAMAVQKYDIQRPESKGGGFEERYWSPVNSPVLNDKGQLRYLIHHVEDVTEFVRLRREAQELDQVTEVLRTRAGKMEAEVYGRALQLDEANRQLREINQGLYCLYDQIAELMTRTSVGSARNPAHTASLPENMLEPGEMVTRIERLVAGHQRLEDELRQAQKMEAVGRLAGGIAHDFNNLLTVITGYAELALAQPEENAVPNLQEIEKAAMRAASLTKQLLTFSRKQILRPQVIDLNAVVGGMEELLRRLIGEHISLVTVTARGVPRIKADRGQLEQVVMNLAVNARDAMPAGGRLIIETRGVLVDPNESILQVEPGSYALLSVTDTGHGMDAETRSRIFEPFFTTKEPGKGTGLGLATVYGIVQQSGGSLIVESAPGMGSVFRVYLPQAEADANDQIATRPRIPAAGHATSILIVEDEAPLRHLISTVLAAAGHLTFEAANGQEALLKAAKVPGGIDLLLTDVVMPGMTGPDLMDTLRVMRPDLRVLFTSGYDRGLTGRRMAEGNVGFLAKPFSPGALLSKVAELLIGEGRADAASGNYPATA